MIKCVWFVHPIDSSLMSGKDAGSIEYYANGDVAYRAPTGEMYSIPAEVHFDNESTYTVTHNSVQFKSPEGSVECIRKQELTFDKPHSSLDVTHVPNNDAFNAMAMDNSLKSPALVSSTSDQINTYLPLLALLILTWIVCLWK